MWLNVWTHLQARGHNDALGVIHLVKERTSYFNLPMKKSSTANYLALNYSLRGLKVLKTIANLLSNSMLKKT